VETKDLLRILKGVPETRLRIFPFLSKVVGEDGAIDPEKVAFHYKELKEAIDEAEAYSTDTKRAVLCLKQMDHSPP
jgi:hypothetical protein